MLGNAAFREQRYRAKQEKSKKHMTNSSGIGAYAESALAKREWLLVGRDALFSKILELGTIGLHKVSLSVSETSRSVGSIRSYASSDRFAFPEATTPVISTSAPGHGSISASLWGPRKTLQPVQCLPSLHPPAVLPGSGATLCAQSLNCRMQKPLAPMTPQFPAEPSPDLRVRNLPLRGPGALTFMIWLWPFGSLTLFARTLSPSLVPPSPFSSSHCN